MLVPKIPFNYDEIGRVRCNDLPNCKEKWALFSANSMMAPDTMKFVFGPSSGLTWARRFKCATLGELGESWVNRDKPRIANKRQVFFIFYFITSLLSTSNDR